MRTLTVPAPAKLNLFLHVTGRRADGYHALETLFVALDFGDTITLARRADGAIRRVGEDFGVPAELERVEIAVSYIPADPCARHADQRPQPDDRADPDLQPDQGRRGGGHRRILPGSG